MIKTKLFCFFLLLLGEMGYTQGSDDAREIAVKAIKDMKEGVVLVRLRTAENQLDFLKEQGAVAKVAEVREQQKKKNREIMNAFHTVFDFCDAYFFYSDDSEVIKTGYWFMQPNLFVNENLEKDSTIQVNAKHYFVIDIGDVYFKTFGSYMGGLAVMTQKFKVLDPPFPGLVRQREGLKVRGRSNRKMIELCNERLHRFYEQHY